jgi:hypothetical protein
MEEVVDLTDRDRFCFAQCPLPMRQQSAVMRDK